mmetsp:Transcript_88882/g.237934  ORF Transcript_88882/g.237934 Transcript_88882/m.237934 type:complete len:220 (-) Transcript_88882:65-724(-)
MSGTARSQPITPTIDTSELVSRGSLITHRPVRYQKLTSDALPPTPADWAQLCACACRSLPGNSTLSSRRLAPKNPNPGVHLHSEAVCGARATSMVASAGIGTSWNPSEKTRAPQIRVHRSPITRNRCTSLGTSICAADHSSTPPPPTAATMQSCAEQHWHDASPCSSSVRLNNSGRQSVPFGTPRCHSVQWRTPKRTGPSQKQVELPVPFLSSQAFQTQ